MQNQLFCELVSMASYNYSDFRSKLHPITPMTKQQKPVLKNSPKQQFLIEEEGGK